MVGGTALAAVGRTVRGQRRASAAPRLIAFLVAALWLAMPSGLAAVVAAPLPVPAAGTASEAPPRFFVFPDDGVAPLLDFVDGAAQSLDLYIFTLSHPAIEAKLVQAARDRHVAVRAMIEPSPTGRAEEAKAVFERLQRAGLQVQLAGKPFSKTHAKALVADASRAWVGSANFVATWDGTRDYAIVVDEPATVAQLRRTFEDDWSGASLRGGRSGRDSPFRATVDTASNLIVSPANGRSSFVSLLGDATRSIYLEHEQVDDPAMLNLLVERSQTGVAIRLVLDDSAPNQQAAKTLRQRAPAIQVQFRKRPKIHAKLTVVDETRMIVGSHNLTKDSLDERREISIVVVDPAAVARAIRTLAADYSGSSSTASRSGPSGGSASSAALVAGSAASSGDAGSAADSAEPGTSAQTQEGKDMGALLQNLDVTSSSAPLEISWPVRLLHLLLAAVLAALIAYRPWRRLIPHMSSPEREVADTQVLIAVAGAVVVTVIGDNLARAFGLVGLGGVVRFRSNIRDTRDAGLMFMMIAIGMASGLGLLSLAVLIAAFSFAGMAIFDFTLRMRSRRVSLRVDDPREALASIRTAFPDVRVIEAPNSRAKDGGTGTVVMDLNGISDGADAVTILEMLQSRGVRGVRNLTLDED